MFFKFSFFFILLIGACNVRGVDDALLAMSQIDQKLSKNVISERLKTHITNNLGRVSFTKDVGIFLSSVELTATQSKDIDEIFDEFMGLFSVRKRSNMTYRISTGDSRPNMGTVEACITVPESLVVGMLPDESLIVFAGIEQGGAHEVPFIVFDPVDSYFDSEKRWVCANLPPFAFSSNDLTMNRYQALLVLGLSKRL